MLHRCLGALGIAHHPDNTGKKGVGAHFIGLDVEVTALVQGTGKHLVPLFLDHRHRFAGEHALIHVGAAVYDHAIHRNAAAGFDGHHIAGTHILRFRLQADERTDSRRSAVLGPFFQKTPKQDERHDHGGRFKIEVRLEPPRSPDLREQQVKDREKIGDAHGKGHQRIHVGASMAHSAESGLVKTPAAPEDHRCSQSPKEISL